MYVGRSGLTRLRVVLVCGRSGLTRLRVVLVLRGQLLLRESGVALVFGAREIVDVLIE